MPKTLLTGANGFLAAHLIQQLISDGHQVTGTVRSLSKGNQILDAHPEWKGKIEFIEVSRLSDTPAWDAVFENSDFDYVIHNAGPMPDNPTSINFDRDFLEPNVAGDISLLKSAKAHGSNIKHIAFVGSINSVTDGAAESIANKVFTTKDWIPYTIEQARSMQNSFISYCVAKKEAEKAIWNFVETEKPHFTVTVFLPCLVFGPAIHYVNDINKINLTNDIIYSYINGSSESIPPTPFPSYIDARDIALAHVRSLTTAAAANKRFLIGGFPYSSTLAVETLRSLPELEGRLPTKAADEVIRVMKQDVSEANEIFQIKYRTAKETFHDTARKLLELEKKLGVAT